MKKLFVLLLAAMVVVASCKKDEKDTTDTLIKPSESDRLSDVLIMPNGSERFDGDPPSPTNSTEAPTVDNNVPNLTSSNGSTAPLFFDYANVNGNLGGCYAQVEGASSYYRIPYGSNSGASGSLSLPVGIPSNVDQGEFCVNFCVYDNQGRVSNIVRTCVTVLRLGSGSLQISLSWNRETDQDLHVTDPNGEEIYYSSPTSSTGGKLDRDDTDGYGPENIFWTESAPSGDYVVDVVDFTNNGEVNNFFVTVSAGGVTKSFNGTASNGDRVRVLTITKSGDTYNF